MYGRRILLFIGLWNSSHSDVPCTRYNIHRDKVKENKYYVVIFSVILRWKQILQESHPGKKHRDTFLQSQLGWFFSVQSQNMQLLYLISARLHYQDQDQEPALAGRCCRQIRPGDDQWLQACLQCRQTVPPVSHVLGTLRSTGLALDNSGEIFSYIIL